MPRVGLDSHTLVLYAFSYAIRLPLTSNGPAQGENAPSSTLTKTKG